MKVESLKVTEKVLREKKRCDLFFSNTFSRATVAKCFSNIRCTNFCDVIINAAVLIYIKQKRDCLCTYHSLNENFTILEPENLPVQVFYLLQKR